MRSARRSTDGEPHPAPRHLTGTLGTLLTTLRAGSTRVWQSKPDHRWLATRRVRSQEFSIGADQRDISHSALAAQHAS